MSNLDSGMLKQIKHAIETDSLIIFVGAGVSKNSGLPLWDDIVDVFKEELNLQEQDDTNVFKVPQYYYDTFGQNRYFQKLEEIFKLFNNAEPNFAHDYIAKIKPKHIITTNYDDLLEKRFSVSDMQYDVITEDSDIPYSRSDHYLIKMHGELSRKNIVLKENDYLEYEDNFYMVSNLIKSLIMNHTVLFLGYSLNDPTFNSIFSLIQKSFGNNAKRAYLYTPDVQSDTQVKYYEKKGVHILSNADTGRSKSALLKSFLENFDNDIDAQPQSAEQIWDKIKFLNHLNFIEASTVARYTKLVPHAYLIKSNEYLWFYPNEDISKKFLVSENNDITQFITNKTRLVKYLDFETKPRKQQSSENSVLKPAFDLYKSKKYAEAKLKFREAANLSYKRGDYWHYLVAEFNIEHIGVNIPFEQEKSLPESVVAGVSFEKVMDGLILRGSPDTRQLVQYFKDEIQSFKFIYRKLFKLDKLLDSLREERVNYKNGGISWNSHLFEVREEMASLANFIEYNELATYHYSEYQKVVDRYFEALLQALDNSQTVPKKDGIFFGETSSTIDKLTWQDLQPILNQWRSKSIDVYMDSLQFNKIKIETDAFENIIQRLLKSLDNEVVDEYSRLIDVIDKVEIYSIESIVTVFSKYPLQSNNSRSLRKILNILWQHKSDLTKEQKKVVLATINNQVNMIFVNEDWQVMHSSNVNVYERLLKFISETSTKTELTLPDLQKELFLIKGNFYDLKKIERFSDYIEKLYSFFNADTKQLVRDILQQYETNAEIRRDLFFVIDLILSGVYEFKSLKKWILRQSVEVIDKQRSDDVQTDPDRSVMAIAGVFNLLQEGYFTRDDIAQMSIITDDIKGKYPEIDWIWFGVHTTDVVGKLLENRSFNDAKATFGTSPEEAQVFNDWAILKAQGK